MILTQTTLCYIRTTRSFKKGAVLALISMCCIFCSALWAQGGAGAITGIVTDPAGAILSNAEVTLTNTATGMERKTQTTDAGVYTFNALSVVGTYTLSVQQQGFTSYKRANITVSVGSTTTQDIHLELGTAKDAITVEAGAETVETTQSQVSQLVESRVWKGMPLGDRNQNYFINLVAGATPDAGSTRGASVNGARGGTGNYMVEGMDNNDQGQGGRGQINAYNPGGAVTSISPDAIQEYRVITNSFAAEYGKAGGFVTDTVLRSGTNQIHGSLFEYNRAQVFAANNFFSNRAGIKDGLVRNQFGGSISGPIRKDKTFFFGELEFHRSRQSGALSAVGTTKQYLDWVNGGGMQTWAESDPRGICMQYSGHTCPGAFSAIAKTGAIFNKMITVSPFPVAAAAPCVAGAKTGPCIGQGEYTAGLEFPVPVYGDVVVENPYQLNEYKIVNKIDHRLSNRDQLSYMLILQNAESGSPYAGGGATIGPAYLQNGRNLNTGVTWSRMASNNAFNVFKVSYLRHRQDFPSPNPALDSMPMVVTNDDSLSVGLGLSAALPQYFTDNTFQFQDHFSLTSGKHNFKTGWEYRRIRNGSSFHNDGAGTFLPWAVEDLVTDLAFTDVAARALGEPSIGSVYYASAAVDSTTGKVPMFHRGYRANELATYFQDDWRISHRLTMNYGLRWEYFGPPHNFQENIDSNFYFGTPVTPVPTMTNNVFFPNTPFAASLATGTFQVRNHELWIKDTNNFGPRLGFSWDVFGNQKLVMRAGGGIMYDRIFNNVFENIRFNPPYYSDNQIGYPINGVPVGSVSTPGLYGYPFTSTSTFNQPQYAPKPNPRHMDQNLVTPYYEQAHFGFQYDLGKGYVFEPEYVGTFGHKLIGYYDINTFDGRMACPPKAYSASSLCGAAGYLSGFGSSRINNAIGADNFRTNGFGSNYHGLQLSLRKNYTHGLGFQSNYTWSKSMDTLSDAFNFRTANVTDVQNVRYDYGPSDFNIKHRFVTNLTYDVPFAKRNRWIGGWQINTIVQIQSGTPFSPYSSSSTYDVNKDGRANDRVVAVAANGMATVTGHSAADGYFDPAGWTKYSCPVSVNHGLWCDAPIGRNSMTGPGYWNTDLGVTKRFRITERSSVSFQGNLFNLFNHANFGLPTANINSANFGKSTTTANSARNTQLALRFDF